MRKLYASWSNGDDKETSHFSNTQRVYFNEDNRQCEDNKIQKDLVTGSKNNITEMLCKLVKEQLAPQEDLKPFDGNPLEYTILCQCLRRPILKNNCEWLLLCLTLGYHISIPS